MISQDFWKISQRHLAPFTINFAVAANVTSVMLSIGTNLETISEKYEKYYKEKGDEEYNKFEEALKNAPLEDVLKRLEG